MIFLKKDKFELGFFLKNEVNYANDTFMITMQVDFV